MTRLAFAFLLVPAAAAAHASAANNSAAEWNWQAWLIAALFFSAIFYIIGYLRLGQSASRVMRWRATAFFAAWLVLVVALISPLDGLGAELFSAHMVQHEVLMLIAAPLFVLAKPLAVFTWALLSTWRSGAARSFKTREWRKFWHAITTPFTAWSIHALVLWVWHAPMLFEASLHDDAIHELQHLSFFFSALLFWWSVLKSRNNGNAALYVLTTMIHTGLLGALLTFAPSAWYPHYVETATRWGLTALEDQQLGGLVMWLPAGLILMFAGLAMLWRWLEEPKGSRI